MSAPRQDHILFCGLGRMGTPMAARLCAAGFLVSVFDARPGAAAEFAAGHGAQALDRLEAGLPGADVLITMLPDDAAVRQVMQAAAAGLRPGSVAIDMGTSSPATTVALAAEMAARGIGYVDAPVMGGVVFATDGTLDIMAGGRDDHVQRCTPLLQAMGRRVLRCAGPGTGHALKALANFVNASALATLLEAMTVGRACGLSSEFMAEALAGMCTGRQHPLEKKIVPHVLTGKFATGMAMGLIAKDVAIAASLAEGMGAPAPIARHTAELWAEAARRFGAQSDQTEVVRLWTDAAGVTL